jgi:hypothetical protein
MTHCTFRKLTACSYKGQDLRSFESQTMSLQYPQAGAQGGLVEAKRSLEAALARRSDHPGFARRLWSVRAVKTNQWQPMEDPLRWQLKRRYEPMPIKKNRFARSHAIKVIGLSRCIGLSRRTGWNQALVGADNAIVRNPAPRGCPIDHRVNGSLIRPIAACSVAHSMALCVVWRGMALRDLSDMNDNIGLNDNIGPVAIFESADNDDATRQTYCLQNGRGVSRGATPTAEHQQIQ